MNPNERPRYSVDIRAGTATMQVEAEDWPTLLSTAILAVSDLTVRVGTFQTWTARRLSVRGVERAGVLHAILESAMTDWTSGGFLTALVEWDPEQEGRVTAILRGGRVDPDDPRPAVDPRGIVADGTTVSEPSGAGGVWRARFGLRLA